MGTSTVLPGTWWFYKHAKQKKSIFSQPRSLGTHAYLMYYYLLCSNVFYSADLFTAACIYQSHFIIPSSGITFYILVVPFEFCINIVLSTGLWMCHNWCIVQCYLNCEKMEWKKKKMCKPVLNGRMCRALCHLTNRKRFYHHTAEYISISSASKHAQGRNN